MPGLQQQRGGHQSVIRHVQVQPVRQPVAFGFDVLEDGVYVAGDSDAESHVAVGSQSLQAAVGLLRRLPDIGVSSGALVVVQFPQDSGASGGPCTASPAAACRSPRRGRPAGRSCRPPSAPPMGQRATAHRAAGVWSLRRVHGRWPCRRWPALFCHAGAQASAAADPSSPQDAWLPRESDAGKAGGTVAPSPVRAPAVAFVAPRVRGCWAPTPISERQGASRSRVPGWGRYFGSASPRGSARSPLPSCPGPSGDDPGRSVGLLVWPSADDVARH